MVELTQQIDTWNSELIFKYIGISIIILWLCINLKVDRVTAMTFTIILFVIGYFNDKYNVQVNNLTVNRTNKSNEIKPNISNNIKEHHNIVDFLFSIQDLYAYNPQNYEEMINNIEFFYDKFKLSFVDKTISDINCEHMEQYKRNSLNALKSIIFSSPNDNNVRMKINKAVDTLDEILTNDLKKISYLIDDNIFKNGYNVDSKIIDYNVKSYNSYISNYEIY